MKKFTAIGITVVFVLFSFISCGKKPAAPKAGTAKAEDVLSLIPKDVKGIFLVDFHRAMTVETVEKAIKEDESYAKYQEFVEKSGIDPQKDVYFIAGAITAGIEKPEQEGVGVVNLKYTKEILLSLIKEKEKELTEEEYNGVTVYSVKKEEKKGTFAFLDDSNIVVGNPAPVKSVIDIYQKKGENVFKNEDLSALIEKTNKDAMFWGAVLFPPEAMDKVTSENPMLSNLKSVNAAALYFDYLNKNIIAEIKVMSSDATKNQQIAEFLTGLKAMGAMAATEKPEIGEVMDKIEISSGEDHVKIYANVPEELLSKLKKEKMKEGEEEEKEEGL